MNSTALALKPQEKQFEQDAAASYTMPARYYFDPAIFEFEKSAIFYRSWNLVGHRSRLQAPGSYITSRIHEQNVFVIRGRDGELRAFYNVCQHRGHELLEGSGSTKLITCPYHAWCYGLDGKLRSARNTNEMPGFDACDFSLKEVRVEELAGFVFVNCDPHAEPLSSQVEGLEDEIRSYVPCLDELVFARRDEYRVASNWKVLIDNFLECYHCQVAHTAFVDMVDMPSYRSRAHGIYSSHISTGASSTSSSAYRFSADERHFGYAAWFLWPNLTIWVMPGEPNISILQMNPTGPETTLEFLDWYLLSDTPSEEMNNCMTYLDQVLQPEDIGLCESVQRGLHSFGYTQGRFVIDDEKSELSEHAVHHFQNLVLNALENGR